MKPDADRLAYSWSSFGREAEYVVALYLKSVGWTDVRLSPGSRGPADLIAACPRALWYIQVKASSGVPRLKGPQFRALMKLAAEKRGLPVVSTVQPYSAGAFSTGNFAVNFYELDSWAILDPSISPEGWGSAKLRSRVRQV